ncbi:hypothetical protein ALT785_700029 [Alteromonas infernus]
MDGNACINSLNYAKKAKNDRFNARQTMTCCGYIFAYSGR